MGSSGNGRRRRKPTVQTLELCRGSETDTPQRPLGRYLDKWRRAADGGGTMTTFCQMGLHSLEAVTFQGRAWIEDDNLEPSLVAKTQYQSRRCP